MSPSVLALLTLLPFLSPILAQATLAEFQQSILAGLQALGHTQSTANLASVATQAENAQLIEHVYATSNETAWTFYSPTNEAWAAFNWTVYNDVPTIAYHFAGASISPSYVTPNYTLVTTGHNNFALPARNGSSLDPIVVVKSPETQFDIIRGSDFNASAISAGGKYGIQVVPIDKVLTAPPTLGQSLAQDLIRAAENSTVSTNFTSFTAFLNGFGYLKQFEGINKGITVFAPTDGAFQAAAEQLAKLSDKDKAVVAMNHIFQGEVLYSPILAGSAQLSSSSGGRLSWCRDCGNSTGQSGLSLLVVGTNVSANVLRTDVLLSNGVLHVIDGILLNTKNNTRSANQAPSKTGSTTKATSTGPASTGVGQSGGAVVSVTSLPVGSLAGSVLAIALSAGVTFLL